MSPTKILWYFADPMCSWCWGFSPVIESIKSRYDKQLTISLMMGGLRPGVTEPMTESLRTEILHHWHEVHKMTGQPFQFVGAMPDGFIYDTEPASRAVVTMGEVQPDAVFAYFKSVQTAFYRECRDVTKTEILAELANQQGIATAAFLTAFESDVVKHKIQLHFQGTRQAGVRGFPSLVLQRATDYQFIAKGYRPLNELTSLIDTWLHEVENIM